METRRRVTTCSGRPAFVASEASASAPVRTVATNSLTNGANVKTTRVAIRARPVSATTLITTAAFVAVQPRSTRTAR
jgi:hypothetical protein